MSSKGGQGRLGHEEGRQAPAWTCRSCWHGSPRTGRLVQRLSLWSCTFSVGRNLGQLAPQEEPQRLPKTRPPFLAVFSSSFEPCRTSSFQGRGPARLFVRLGNASTALHTSSPQQHQTDLALLSQEVTSILQRLKKEVVATEELIRVRSPPPRAPSAQLTRPCRAGNQDRRDGQQAAPEREQGDSRPCEGYCT